MLTQARLKEVLEYNPISGDFFWLTQQSQSTVVGTRAGWTEPKGYWCIGIDRRSYKAHRLAWLYVHGHWPRKHLDHINRVKTDNRLANLREATNAQNTANSKVYGCSGLKGAYYRPRLNKWVGAVNAGGKQFYLGLFNTAEEAHAAYCKFAPRIHGEFFCAGGKAP